MADSSKTEQATPRRRQRAREDGQVVRSRELTGALTMVAVAGVIAVMGRSALGEWAMYFRAALDSATHDSFGPNGPLLFWTNVESVKFVFPILIAALGVSVLTALAQGGFVVASDGLAPKFDRISPAERLKQLVSPIALSTILRSLLPFTAIGWVGYASLRSHWSPLLFSSYMDVRESAGLLTSIVLEICWKSGLILVLWAGVDYLLLWRKSESDMKMSRQDLKEEMKDSEGNPANKARIRKLQRHSRRKQMLKAAETATVVITNPTHYAVALRYEVNMAAPIVVAKGLDNLAQKIKEIARQHSIPVMENKPLAQSLYKSVEIGDRIPSELYHAVAEILVVVYKAEAEMKKREAQRSAAAARVPAVAR
jgi:flagellar biosynthesis protein FlhB